MCPLALLFHPTLYSQRHFHHSSCFNVVCFFCFCCLSALSLGSRGTSGLVGSKFINYFQYSCFILFSVAFDVDCLSVVCPHTYSFVEVLSAILVHTFVGNLAILFGGDREDEMR